VSGVTVTGAQAGNYTVTQQTGLTANVTPKALTVAATAASKAYDGTTTAAALPIVTSGTLVGTDTAAFFETYDTENVGTSKTLTPAGSVNDGNDGKNYTVTFVTKARGAITAQTPTVSVTDAGGAYNGSPYPATATVAGVAAGIDTTPAASLEGVTPTKTYYGGSEAIGTGSSIAPSAAGTYTVIAFFAGSADYVAAQSAPVTFTITPVVNPTIGTEILGVNQPGFWSSAASTWTTSTQGLDGASLISSTANGSKSSQAAWWFSMPAGTYDIAITYTASTSLTTQLGLDLYDGVGHWIGQAKVNEQVAPSDFTDQGVQWKRLGSFTLTNNIFHISTWNSATDGAICISAIEIRAVPMINDSDASGIKNADAFSITGTWTTNTTAGAFGDSHVSNTTAGSGTSTATWTLPVLSSGTYELDATWVNSSALSANATYNIYDGSTLLSSVSVNQKSAPSGVTDEGINWTSLGSFTFSSQVKVMVSNTATDGQVCADAIRVRPAYQPTEVVKESYPGSWYNSDWSTIPSGLYGDALVSNTPNGSKQSQVAWWFPCRPGQYEVDVTWVSGASYSTNIGFDVYNGLKWLKTATVNEQNAPVGATDLGVVWQSLGTFTMTGNVLHVSTWNSPTDGAICVDGVRIVPVGTTTNGVEQPASAAMAVVATPLATAPVPLESNGWFIEPLLAASEKLTPAAGLSQCSFNETGSVSLGPDQLKAIDPQAVDKIDLPSVVGQEANLLGLGDLDASLDALMSDQLGAGVRRLP
jgi:hypothetical protein